MFSIIIVKVLDVVKVIDILHNNKCGQRENIVNFLTLLSLNLGNIGHAGSQVQKPQIVEELTMTPRGCITASPVDVL
jgi:hypothetical protein